VHWGLIPDMTGTHMLSHLVRDDVMNDLVLTGRILHATEGATLGLVTRLADDPVEFALHMAREIASRSPHAVRGAKKLNNHLSNDCAKEHFALEREIIFKLIGSPNQVEAITANFEKRESRFGDVGYKFSRTLLANFGRLRRPIHQTHGPLRASANRLGRRRMCANVPKQPRREVDQDSSPNEGVSYYVSSRGPRLRVEGQISRVIMRIAECSSLVKSPRLSPPSLRVNSGISLVEFQRTS
jgi:hypothetical protein